MSWEKGSRVKFKDDRIPSFLDALAQEASKKGFSLYATSAYRSPEDQVRVVCTNVANTNGANLSIYDATTQSMYRDYDYCNTDRDKLIEYETEKLQRRIDRDPTYQAHGTGEAVDIRIRDLTHDQRVEFKKVIEGLGARVLWETSPLHFHVWLGDWVAPKKSSKLLMVLGLTSVGAAIVYRKQLAKLIGLK